MLTNQIQSRILLVRGAFVLIDYTLAELYEVTTKSLNQAVKRNIDRFPGDFMFQLSGPEWHRLCAEVTSIDNRSQFVTGSQRHRNSKFLPFAFTEQGVAMLSSVLRSRRAIQVNIAIMRAFVLLHQYRNQHKKLAEEIEQLELTMNRKFKDVFEALHILIAQKGNSKEIGFKQIGRT